MKQIMESTPIQKAILRKAIESPLFSKDVAPRVPLSIFEGNETYKELFNTIKMYYQTSRDVLTENAFLALTQDKLDRMKRDAETQQFYFNEISNLYQVRDSGNNDIIDEQIEKYIRKHMRMDLLVQATKNLDNEKFMDNIDEKWKEIMLLDINGKNSDVMNVLDDTEEKRRLLNTIMTNALPTGFKAIDNITGGGLGRGELGLVAMPSGGGKCVTGDTLIITEKGIIPIQDIPEHFHVDPITNESTAKVASYHQDGTYEHMNTSHWYNLGNSKTIKLTTKSGYEIEGTHEHPLLVMNEEGNLEYKELRDFKKGDYLALAKSDMWATNNKIDEEEAYMLGLLVADGYLAQDSGLIAFSNSEDKLVKYYKEQAEKLWGISHIYSQRKAGSRTYDHLFGNITLKRELEAKGLKMVKSASKEIPHSVLQSSKPVVRRFLQAMFDTEASVSEKNIELTTASERLSKQLQILLLNFGVRATRRPKKVKGYNQLYYRITISGLALRVFTNEIGFRFNDKYATRIKEISQRPSNTNVEVFPYQQSRLQRIRRNHLADRVVIRNTRYYLGDRDVSFLLYDKKIRPSKKSLDYFLSYTNKTDEDIKFLRNITNNMIFEPVETIAENEAVVYDFTVPVTHSFVANGIISHNTLILTNFATNYVKLKLNVLYIALEELKNRMVLRFEQSMLRRTKADILTNGVLNEANFAKHQEVIKNNRAHLGNLFFARYSPRTITSARIEQLISDIMIREGIRLDVVIVDYPDLLRNPHATGNESDDGGKLYEEMRRIAQDYDVAMWTASQLNRTAYSADIKTSEHIEGSIRKRNAAEIVLVGNQTEQEYLEGYTRLLADKVRNNPDGKAKRMLGFRVIGNAQTVRDYADEREMEHHQSLLDMAADEKERKRNYKQRNDKGETIDYSAEINATIKQGRGL